MPVILFALWVVFNARLDVEIAVTGLVVTAFVYRFMVKHMGYSHKTDLKIVKKLGRGIKYIGALIWQTARSNKEVSGFVFRKRLELKPQLIFFKTPLKSDAARVTLANSITLTPGTITVSEDEGTFGVHCLNHHMGEGLDDSSFVRILKTMEDTDGDD